MNVYGQVCYGLKTLGNAVIEQNCTNTTVIYDLSNIDGSDNIIFSSQNGSTARVKAIYLESETLETYNTQISINANEEEYLTKNQKYQLNISSINLDLINGIDLSLLTDDFIFTSENEEVASVSQEGLVTGVGLGQTVITAYNEKYNITFGIKYTVVGKEADKTAHKQALQKHILLKSSFEDEILKDDIQNTAYVVNGSIKNTVKNSRVGTDSAYFSGTAGQRLRLDRENLNFGTKDFTIEFYAYAETQVMGYPLFVSDEANSSMQFFIADSGSSGNISLVNNGARIINSGKKYIANEWVKYKVIRKDGVFKIYENDILIGSTSSYLNTNVNLSNLAIGGNSSTSNTAFKGYIDDLTIYDIAIEGDMDVEKVNKYIKVGQTTTISIQNTGASILANKKNLESSDFKWSSLNEDVATVNGTGVVTGKSVGYTTITGYNEETGVKVRAIINVYNNKNGAITVPQTVTGNGFSVILKEDGTVWTTGLNNLGQLGNGTKVNSYLPVQVKTNENTYLTNVKQITAGEDFVAALTFDNKVYAWGNNNYGQLGQGNTTELLYATNIKKITEATETTERKEENLENIIQISAGNHAIFMLTNEGEVYGCGYGANYEFLDNSTANHKVVSKVESINNCIKIEAGYQSLFAMLSNGETWSWGYNYYGQ